MIQVRKCHPNAKLPSKGSEEAGGMDLYSEESFVLPPGERRLVPTGIELSIPRGYVGLIWPRSKLANKHGIDVLAGVVDSDYRGQVHVIVQNHGMYTVHFEHGEAIAQMIVQQHSCLPIIEVGELSDTMRGNAGITSEEQRRGLEAANDGI
jgi:dUTP pyrophosphatase